MRKTKDICWGVRAFAGVLALAIVLMAGFMAEPFAIVSHAQSQGKIKASSVNIRQNADPDSAVIGSGDQGAEVTINGKITGTDGNTWYQVFVNAQTLGYVRSDLIDITDGSTPTTLTSAAAGTTATAAPQAPPAGAAQADVLDANPISATVTGGQKVRVRSSASTTTGEIVTTVQDGLVVTVTGWVDGADNYTWYWVNFSMNGSEITGFIRQDYLNLSGEVTPLTVEAPDVGAGNGDAPQPDAPEVFQNAKLWDTQLVENKWKLIDYNGDEPKFYDIENMFETVQTNYDAYSQVDKMAKNLKAVIIILVIVIIALAAVVTLLIFKIRDMADSAYFSDVENEAARRRSADRPQGNVQKSARPHGGQRPVQGGSQGRPAQGGRGPRPVQGGSQGRPAQGGQGPRPVQGGSQGRPAQEGSQGPRPVQGGSQGRPAQGGRGPRPVQGGSQGRPAQGSQGPRPVQGGSQGRPAQGSQGQRSVQDMDYEQLEMEEQTQPRRKRNKGTQSEDRANGQKQGWKSRNFMAEDDEFEFEFLNWDGEEDQ